MLRSIIIYLSKADWARRLVMGWGIARRTALRFVAGETIQDAIRTVQELNAQGLIATLDHLGEDTGTPEEARQATEDIIGMLDSVQNSGVCANVSIKLTQIGLNLDEKLCAENLIHILERARQQKNFVRIDMEDSNCVDVTLRLYHRVRHELGFDNVGLVIQSYLYRSEDDTRQLMTDKTCIRLVKGAYDEPPEVAFPKKADTDACFDRLTAILLDTALEADAPALSADGKWPPLPAIGTHDEKRIEFAKQHAAQIGLPKQKLEFQLLFGIRRELQTQLSAEGYPVRIYVPFGTEWYPYFMRRLAERPANIWFFIANFLRH